MASSLIRGKYVVAGVTSRTEAVKIATRRGLVRLE